MVRAGDAILQATDSFIEAKKDSLKLSIASKQATQAQDLAIQASKHLKESFNNSPDGEFNAEAELKWYDEQVSKLTSGIPNKDARTKYENLLKRNRGSFAISANEFEFKDQIQVEQKNSQIRSSNFAISLQDESQDPDDLLINTLEANKYARETTTRTDRANYDTQDEQFAIQAVSEKANRLNRDFALRKITREQYEQGLESVDSLLKQPGVLDHVDAKRITGMFDTIDQLKTNSRIKAEENYVSNLKSDIQLEKQRLLSGGLPSEQIVADVTSASTKYPEDRALQKEKAILDILVNGNNQNIFTSIKIGDVKSVQSEINKLEESLETETNGLKFSAMSDVVSALKVKAQAAKQLRLKNTAEAFKNNPAYKSAWAKVLSDNTPESRAEYVSTLISLDKSQGGNGQNIEFFNEQIVQNYTEQLEGMTAEQMNAQILSIQSEWGQDLGHGAKAWQGIINQISNSGNPVNLAARYVGTPSFKKIYTMQKLSQDELKLVAGGKTEMTDLKDGLLSELTDYVQVQLERNPDNPGAVAREIEAIYKTAAGAPLDSSSGVDIGFGDDESRTKAIQWAIDLHVNNHVKVRKKGRVNVAIPTDATSQAEAKEIFKTPTSDLVDIMMRETAKRAGVPVALRGDEDALLQEINGVDYETFDYRSLRDAAKVINNESGGGYAVSVPVKIGTVPGSFKNKEGETVLVSFSSSELYNMIQEKKNRVKQEKLQKVKDDFEQRRRGSFLGELGEQFKEIDEKDKEIQEILKGNISN